MVFQRFSTVFSHGSNEAWPLSTPLRPLWRPSRSRSGSGGARRDLGDWERWMDSWYTRSWYIRLMDMVYMWLYKSIYIYYGIFIIYYTINMKLMDMDWWYD
jgi:hypothetical protein